jgi:hypothetical protein
MPIIAAVVVVLAGAYAYTTGVTLGHELWMITGLAVLAFATLALTMWHRRQLAYIREQHLVIIGRYRNLSMHKAWPKACLDCGHEASDWRGCRDHDNTETSPCAAFLYNRERAEMAPETLPNENWQADILGPHDRNNADDKTAIGG